MVRPHILAVAASSMVMCTLVVLMLAQNVRGHAGVATARAATGSIETGAITPAEVLGGPRWAPATGDSAN